MADSTGSSSFSEKDVVELEAMRKDTFSWHPCKVSLCSSSLGLLVQYGDDTMEEVISDKDEVEERVRVCSAPLQGDDCSLLRQGDHVVAIQNSQVKNLFLDAEVKEVLRVRHSKRNCCRCLFKIKWLHQGIEEKASTVSASAIMKLSMQNIILHPSIATFFSRHNGFKASPFLSSLEDMELEVDISALLEKQIVDISESSPHKKISSDMAFELNGALKEEPRATALEFTGSRSLLNPLAARAALALFRSKHPQSVENSPNSNVEEGYNTRAATNFSSNTDDFFSKPSSTSGRNRSQKFDGITKNLFSASNSPPQAESPKASSGAQGKKRKKKEKSRPLISEAQRVTRSTSKAAKNIKCPKGCSSDIQKPTNGKNGKYLPSNNGMTAKADSQKGFARGSGAHNSSRRITRSAAQDKTRQDSGENSAYPKRSTGFSPRLDQTNN